jgi:hypothetical protein
LASLRHSDQALAKIAEDSRHAAEIGGLGWDEVRAREIERTDIGVQLSQAELDVALNLAALRLVTGTIEFDGAGAAAQDAGLFRSLHF